MNDLLTKYLAEASKWPLLSVEDEATATSNELVKHNLRLVVKVAMKYGRGSPHIQDIVQDGNIGLIRASRLFDPAKGKFSVFAWPHIESAIKEGRIVMARMVRIPRKAYRYYNRIVGLDRRGQARTEIAALLGLPLSNINAVLDNTTGPIFEDTEVVQDPEPTLRDVNKLSHALAANEQCVIRGYVEGYSMCDIAKKLSMTAQGASFLRKQAIDKMRAAL